MTRAGRRTSGFRPVRIIEIELTEPVPALPEEGPARLLVRHAGRPVGFVPVAVPPGGLDREAVRDLVAARSAPAPDAVAVGPHPHGGGVDRAGSVPATAGAQTGRSGAARPTVSVVVPTCGDPGLPRTLDGLAAQTLEPDEIIVVDNRPGTSDVRRLLDASVATGVSLVEEPRRGSSQARNAGLAQARGEIVAFTDDDVVVDPGWLAALVDGFTDDQVACVTGLVLPLELDTPAQCWLEEYGGYAKGFDRRRFDLDDHRGDGVLYPYAAGVFGTGASAAFRATALREVGGFDEDLGAGTPARGGEDLDIYLTVVRSGRALVYEPAALVRHAHHRDTAALRRQVYGYGVGLSAMLAKRWATGPEERRDLLARALAGARHLVHPASPKNRNKTGSYPVSLTLIEMAGLLCGPFAYRRSRRSW